MGRLDDKVAIITGAGGGMGREQMRLFAKEGAKVVGVDMAVDSVQEVVDEIKNQGGEALAIKLDITSPEQWQAVVAQTVETFGKVDALLHYFG